MNILENIFKSSLIQNEQNIRFWEDYLKNLNELDLNTYSDKLTVPVLVPVGNKIFFRGAIKHTNEVLVPLGADYFTKCSVKQAEILRQHRIKDAKQKLEAYNKEKEYLESQISFSKENVYGNSGQEIIETVNEEEDKAWREQHKERLKQYYQNKSKEADSSKGIPDEELWLRLEELELQEEMQNELESIDNKTDIDESDVSSYDSFIIKEDDISNIQTEEINQNSVIKEAQITHNIPKQTSKIDLLEQVIDRQRMLEVKLTELKNRERNETKSEHDLLSRLDEMEQLDELEDEMDRLDDILEEDDNDNACNKISKEQNNFVETHEIKRSVSFADRDDAETLEITFKHSSVEPSTDLHTPEKGIVKPSDIYKAYSNLFKNKKTSILKKPKYEEIILHDQMNNNILDEEKQGSTEVHTNQPDVNRTIVINDITEKSDDSEGRIESDKRPVSLFKKRRQQRKS